MRLLNVIFALLLSVLVTFFVAAPVAEIFAVPVLPVAGLLVAGSMFSIFQTPLIGVLRANPDISALVAYSGKNAKQLISTLVNMLDAVNDLFVVPDLKGSINLTKLTVGRGARPYSSTTQFKDSDLQYTGRKLSENIGKREILIDPLKYRSTYLAEAMKPGVDKRDIPFAQYTWQQVLRMLAAEINDYTVYNGFDKSTAVAFDAGDTYAVGDYVTFESNGITDYYKCITITTAGQSPTTTPAKWQMVNAEAIAKGLGTIVAEEVTGGNLSPIATGAIVQSTAVEQFEAMMEAMPASYRKSGFEIKCSWDSFDLYGKDYRDKFKKYVEMDADGSYYLDRTAKKVKIKPCTWMGSSGRLIASPYENMLMGTDKIADLSKIETKENLWTLEAGIAFVLAFQIADLDAMRVNDQS